MSRTTARERLDVAIYVPINMLQNFAGGRVSPLCEDSVSGFLRDRGLDLDTPVIEPRILDW